MKKKGGALICIMVLIFSICLQGTAIAEPLRVDAAVERNTVFVGEPFIYQIQIQGSEDPEKPDVADIPGFDVVFQGGQQNSSTSMTIINGRVTRNVKKGYFFSYQLTPKHEGRLTIPPVAVSVDGRTLQTPPVEINVRKPVSTDDFKLRLDLSKTECYVGEPVTLTFTWYFGKDVRGFNFTLPLIEDTDTFFFADPDVNTNTGKNYYRIPLGDGQVIGEKGEGRYNGKTYATISFQKILIPKKSGIVTIEPARVVCEALDGYDRGSRSPGDDFFSDFFGSGRRGRYRKVVVPSNSLSLRISDLPVEGKPDGFDGHVGEYTIQASAVPTHVSIGDPITLTITLSGPEYLDHISLPPLNKQKSLAGKFKIPEERATGEVKGKTKVFTQTIRALAPDVTRIPPVELVYFNTRTQQYDIARTSSIPLDVKPARIVTALDAEGGSPSAVNRALVETWVQGIAYNYEGMDVIRNQRFRPLSWFKSPLWCSLIGFPPLVYLMLLTGSTIARKRNADPLAAQSKKAYSLLLGHLKQAEKSESEQAASECILDELRKYLGYKLGIAGGAITFDDVEDLLGERGIHKDQLDTLNRIFETCEAGRYAGASGNSDLKSLAAEIRELAKTIEKRLK